MKRRERKKKKSIKPHETGRKNERNNERKAVREREREI